MTAAPQKNTIWMQTLTGSAHDLIFPDPLAIDFRRDVAETLARIPRFNGHTEGGPYSVAQHCVLGADALFAETQDATLAAAFLLHDAHEAFTGDITTPVAEALVLLSGMAAHNHAFLKPVGKLAVQVCARSAIATLKHIQDVALHAAAEVPFPLSTGQAQRIKAMDLAMLAAERRDLLAEPPQPWGKAIDGVLPPRALRGRITPWVWTDAADHYLNRLSRWCPAALRGTGPAPRPDRNRKKSAGPPVMSRLNFIHK